MTNYSDAELREIRLIDALVREELQLRGLPVANPSPIDEIIASGAFKAAECRVISMDMVDPNWCERALQSARQPPRLTVVDTPEGPTSTTPPSPTPSR